MHLAPSMLPSKTAWTPMASFRRARMVSGQSGIVVGASRHQKSLLYGRKSSTANCFSGQMYYLWIVLQGPMNCLQPLLIRQRLVGDIWLFIGIAVGLLAAGENAIDKVGSLNGFCARRAISRRMTITVMDDETGIFFSQRLSKSTSIS